MVAWPIWWASDVWGVDGALDVAGGGQDAGVDDEGVAVGLGGLVVMVGVADGGAAGEEEM
jgi:hypothetical protein